MFVILRIVAMKIDYLKLLMFRELLKYFDFDFDYDDDKYYLEILLPEEEITEEILLPEEEIPETLMLFIYLIHRLYSMEVKIPIRYVDIVRNEEEHVLNAYANMLRNIQDLIILVEDVVKRDKGLAKFVKVLHQLPSPDTFIEHWRKEDEYKYKIKTGKHSFFVGFKKSVTKTGEIRTLIQFFGDFYGDKDEIIIRIYYYDMEKIKEKLKMKDYVWLDTWLKFILKA